MSPPTGPASGVLAENESGTTSVFHSADGQQWQQDPSLPADLNDVTAAGTLGGRTIVVATPLPTLGAMAW